MAGKAINIETCTKSEITKGTIPLYNFFIGNSIVLDKTKIFIPIGGVIMPISIIRTMITPYQIGLKPRAITVGNMIGIVRMSAAIISKKQPQIR